jgi:UDP-3-O-[3-hydroxymyristoyl] glucosamine N-acyltransferase
MKLKDIAALLEGEIIGTSDVDIKGVAGLEDAEEGDITFIADKKHIAQALKTKASCIMVKDVIPDTDKVQLKVSDPYFAFVRLLEHFYVKPQEPAGISKLAFVGEDVSFGDNVSVYAFAYISDGVSVGRNTVVSPGVFLGRGVKVGEDCLIYPNVVIREGVTIGNRVIIHAGAVVGSDGFGYVQREGRHHKIPQVGGVVIGDDVEIGANVTIDRATTGTTEIGKGTKIDNLVQVAHNVKIGDNSVIVAQVGIGGSTRIGGSVMVGGQVGIADHVNIESGSMIGAQSGVMSNLPRGVYSGTPVIPHRDWLKSVSLFARLPELNRRIKALEEKLEEFERRQGND